MDYLLDATAFLHVSVSYNYNIHYNITSYFLISGVSDTILELELIIYW